MSWFGKDKTRPCKAEVIRAVEEHFSGCGCEAATHTIHEAVTYYGHTYEYTITRVVRSVKAKS